MKDFSLISILSSLKLTVVCLLFLIFLIFFGTLDQIDNGLYLAQKKYFDSWFLFIGPVPLPAAKLVMWILFLNLLSAFSFKFKRSIKKPGIALIHFGLLLLLISAFVNQEFSQESFVHLQEGESTNIAQDYHKWNLLILNEQGKMIKNFPDQQIQTGAKLQFDNQGFLIEKRFINARFFDTPFAGRIFKELDFEKDYEKNTPALKIKLKDKDFVVDSELQNIFEIDLAGKKYIFVFEREKYTLPFTIELIDVLRELHPGTGIAKSYQSQISIKDSDLERNLTVSMNKPFRSKGYTAYQANFGIDENNNEFSVFAIVHNPNFSLAYIASFVTSLGLFVIMFQTLLKRRSNN